MEEISKYPERRKNFFGLDKFFPDPYANFLSGGFGEQEKRRESISKKFGISEN